MKELWIKEHFILKHRMHNDQWEDMKLTKPTLYFLINSFTNSNFVP